MGLLNALGINLPGPLGGNPFSALTGNGGPLTPPGVIGQGFHSLLPALAQAFTGQLGQQTPDVPAGASPAAPQDPIGYQAQGQATPRNIGGYSGSAAQTDQAPAGAVQPPAMFVAPPSQAPQAKKAYTPPPGLPEPNTKLQPGSADPQALYQGLKQRGFNDAQAAALLGNWKQESEFKTTAYNPGEAATGMMQWREARRAGLVNYARATGRSPTDPNVQMDYTARETGLVPDETHTVRVDPGGPAFARATDLQQANAALKGYIRYGSPYNMGGEGTRLSNAAYYYNQFAGKTASISPTFNAMSAPSGQSVAPGANVQDVPGLPGQEGGKGKYGTAEASNATALAKGAGAQGGSKSRSGGTSGPQDPGAPGGSAHRNELSMDFRRYQVRKNIDHLRALSPVAKIQALENIGKGLSVNGGGSTS